MELLKHLEAVVKYKKMCRRDTKNLPTMVVWNDKGESIVKFLTNQVS